MRISVYREATFSAAHHLRAYRGKCENLHGHNWRVRLYVGRDELTAEGFVMDFKEIDAALARILEPLDHHDINTVPPFDAQNPTAEHIARYIFDRAGAEIARRDPLCRVERVMVWESDRSCAIAERDR